MLFGERREFYITIKIFQIVSRKALIKYPLLHENIQKETDTETEKSIYYNFISFGDSGTVPNLLKQ